ncbi:sigma-70 factor domain-containing protein [Sodalinema gerasimenkoae]|uniref:sigma-70 factor domain-containing protein n=1 Tax=Sodalinema gerasimenkoae TaxID=2862348 RepID=UPI003CCE1A12
MKTANPTLNADTVRTYLHEIGRVPLLTHEQEIILGKQVQAMMALLELRDELSESLDRAQTSSSDDGIAGTSG